MQTLFIRHNLSSTEEILRELWSERIIALHYQNIDSINPLDYPHPGRYALTRLHKACQTGVVVGAAYRSIQPAAMLVGEIEPGTPVEVLTRPNPAGGEFFYKTVRLSNAVEARFWDYPLLAAIQPQHGAISGWPQAEKLLRSILRHERMEWSVDSLHPSQLEVLCYEFMRMKGEIRTLLLPIGRNMPDVDIVGLSANGKKVLAQVTHSHDPKVKEQKMSRLLKYRSPQTNLIFFGPQRLQDENGKICYVPIEHVFSTLAGDPLYRATIECMLSPELKGRD